MRHTRKRNVSRRSSSAKAPIVAKIRRTSVGAYGTRAEWAAITRIVKRRDGHMCCICQSTDFLQVDHILPVARGGKTVLTNLWTLCDICHSRRAGHQKAAKLITHKRRRQTK